MSFKLAPCADRRSFFACLFILLFKWAWTEQHVQKGKTFPSRHTLYTEVGYRSKLLRVSFGSLWRNLTIPLANDNEERDKERPFEEHRLLPLCREVCGCGVGFRSDGIVVNASRKCDDCRITVTRILNVICTVETVIRIFNMIGVTGCGRFVHVSCDYVVIDELSVVKES